MTKQIRMSNDEVAELATVPAISAALPKSGDFGYIVRHLVFVIVSSF
jgi:hypothetical protein